MRRRKTHSTCPDQGGHLSLNLFQNKYLINVIYFGENVAFFTLHNTSDHFFCHRQPTHIGAFMHNFYFLAINNKYLYPFTIKSNFVSMKDEKCKFNKSEAILTLLYPYDEIFTSTRYDSLELIERVSSIKPMRESNTPLCRCSCKERIVLHFPSSVHSRRTLWLSQSKDQRGWSDHPSLDDRRCRLPKKWTHRVWSLAMLSWFVWEKIGNSFPSPYALQWNKKRIVLTEMKGCGS